MKIQATTLTIGVLFLAFLPAPARAGAIPPPELASPATIEGWVRDLYEIGARGEYGYRMPGTPAGHEGARYIEAKFREFGLSNSHIESVDTTLSLPDSWSLTVRAGEKSETIPTHFVRYAAFTGAAGITAPMVYVGQASEYEMDAANKMENLQGKILLVDLETLKAGPAPEPLFVYDPDDTLKDSSIANGVSENWPIANLAESYARAKAYGAVGFVGILNFSVRDNTQNLHWYADGSLPGLYVSLNDGARLKRQLASQSHEATLTLTGTDKKGPISHVFASLPGQSEESIVVHTHHDGWAVNEASGVSVVLALAQYFAQVPLSEREKTIQFVAYDSHFGRRDAHPAAWEAMLEKVAVAVSIEMIAKHFKIVNGEYVDTGLISPTLFGVSKANPYLFQLVRNAILAHDLDRSYVVPQFFGDGNIYNMRGIPLIERIAHNAPQFTNEDTPDKVMMDKLRPTAAAFVDIVAGLDSIDASRLK